MSSKNFYSLFPLVITLSIFFIARTCLAGQNETQNSNSTNDFIRISCQVTRYPDICYETLSAYATAIQEDPAQLANTSLQVTLESAQSAVNFVVNMSKTHNLKPREAGAIKDCVENMKDSVDELQDSLVAMKELEGPNFEMEISNIQTWVSAALTDENTCMDGFEGQSMNATIKNSIRSHIVRVAQLTSNALALVNKLT